MGSGSRDSQRNVLHKTLNIFKGGFYSRDEDVVMSCGIFYIRLASEINQVGGELVGDAWDWFISSTYVMGEVKRGGAK